jgi:1-deoxy-D-xylulose-5-phosphate reductoisomerase
MKRIAVLGSTGSIGTQTLEIVRTNKDIKITALAAGNNIELLEKQIREFKPSIAAVWNEEKAAELKIKTADLDVEILSGMDGLLAAASWKDSQIVVTAIVGMIGILPTIEAIKAGKDIALANKETLVTAGHIIMPLAEQYKVSILPVDSEHSAIFQSLQGSRRADLSKIILTASGGPFRGKSTAELEHVSLADALRHPNWSMGAKITVDSATLMNKGLEYIEAMWLFGLTPDQIEIVVHPQSVIHSAVEFCDGAVIAQLGTPDMAVPIQYALTWPRRMKTSAKRLSLAEYGTLTFERPDYETFACLRHAIEAIRRGGLYPCAINAANEQAVALFLDNKIGFSKIGLAVGHVLETIPCKGSKQYTVREIDETDKTARELVLEYCKSR